MYMYFNVQINPSLVEDLKARLRRNVHDLCLAFDLVIFAVNFYLSEYQALLRTQNFECSYYLQHTW